MDAKDYQHVIKALGGLILLVLGVFRLQFEEPVEQVEPVEPEILVNGSIDRVIDGDTVDVVLDGEVTRVRFIGIDTPETVDPRKEVQCFGAEASQHLADILAGQLVTLEYDSTQGEVDKYGRALAYVVLADGTNVGEKMLRDGFAYEYTYDDTYELQEVFKNAEQDARDSGSGLWSSETCGGNR
jgi:micrococcal nuclease